jgi:Animal haem peroxidase
MGKHATDGGPRYRFSRIVPPDHQLSDEAIRDLAAAMSVGGGSEGSAIPAGYTYLGQFVAHDLSRSARANLNEVIHRDRLGQRNSPGLDLDSLYGAGPGEEDFYDGIRLRVGSTFPVDEDGVGELPGHDLPRRDGGVAAIADERNDANVAVAQTHLAFIHFHNRVVDELTGGMPEDERFSAARDIVVRHYQWMVRTDYLPRVCNPAVLDDVFEGGRKAFEVDPARDAVPTMPIEFAVAAFRFGHSMLRRSYSWNRRFEDGLCGLDLLFQFSADGGDLGGAPRLPSIAVADFRRLYEFKAPFAVPERQFNRAMRIDTALTGPLAAMPAAAFDDTRRRPADPAAANLAFRDLVRARDLDLATGQQTARHLVACGVPVAELSPAEILEGKNGARLDGLSTAARDAIVRDTPLWFYCLREAELNGGVLTGVGARIVAETFHRAIQGSSPSIVKDPAWRPSLGPDGDTFRMIDLLSFAFRNSMNGLAPLEPA